MHAMGGVIDMRRFGGLRRLMPITYWTFLFGWLALAGFPSAGFWSKDEILAALHDRAHHASDTGLTVQAGLYSGLYWLALFAAFLTAFYTFRAFFLTFYGKSASRPRRAIMPMSRRASMTVPLVILAVCSVVVGGYFAWTARLRRVPGSNAVAAHSRRWPLPRSSRNFTPTSCCVSSAGRPGRHRVWRRSCTSASEIDADMLAAALRPLYTLSHGKFFFDEIYSVLVVWPLRVFAYV